jgi:transcriptional regulator with XRE-family HTH domain
LSSAIIGQYGSLVEHDADWSIRLAADIGANVAYHRSASSGARGRRMTVQALADRCAELGLPLGRVALTKLENGVREKVSVAELLVLAAALEVPPALLIFPVGREKAIEALPARQLDPWHATLWLSGDAQLSEDAAGPGVIPASNISVVPLHREHDRLTAGLAGCTRESLLGAGGDDSRGRLLRLGVGALRDVRAFIRELGLDPPELPSGLAWVDDPDV